MTAWFLAFLAVAWIVVYLPSVWRARQKSPFPAVQRFKRRMRLISPRNSNAGRWVVVPEPRERIVQQALIRAQQRRRKIFGGLVVAALVTGIWAAFAGGKIVEFHLIVDAFAAFYLALLMDARRRAVEREEKVRTIHGRRRVAERAADGDAEYGFARVGGGGRT